VRRVCCDGVTIGGAITNSQVNAFLQASEYGT
jgi:hypothetical protein